MNFKQLLKLRPAHWAVFFFVTAQAAAFFIVSRMDPFLEKHDIYVAPQGDPEIIPILPSAPITTTATSGEVVITTTPYWTALLPQIIYFFIVIVVMGLILYFIPMWALKKVFRAIFAVLFAWGVFIALVFWAPLAVSLAVAATVGLLWLITPRIWLHNLMMLLAMASLGAVFGRFIIPWQAMILLGVIAVYDFFAVRFGYMLWLADKLSTTNTLPAFFIPRFISEWKDSLSDKSVADMAELKPADRDFSILGGGDIGFPVLLASSVYFAYGINSALLVAAFALAGIIGAYFIQAVFLKGKPMPALPPIAALSLIGLLIVR